MTQESVNKFRIRLSRKEKEYFERAAELGGFQSLTDFFITAATEKADAIMEKHNFWLSSENDRRIFFNALINPPAPSVRLTQASHSEFNPKKY